MSKNGAKSGKKWVIVITFFSESVVKVGFTWYNNINKRKGVIPKVVPMADLNFNNADDFLRIRDLFKAMQDAKKMKNSLRSSSDLIEYIYDNRSIFNAAEYPRLPANKSEAYAYLAMSKPMMKEKDGKKILPKPEDVDFEKGKYDKKIRENLNNARQGVRNAENDFNSHNEVMNQYKRSKRLGWFARIGLTALSIGLVALGATLASSLLASVMAGTSLTSGLFLGTVGIGIFAGKGIIKLMQNGFKAAKGKIDNANKSIADAKKDYLNSQNNLQHANEELNEAQRISDLNAARPYNIISEASYNMGYYDAASYGVEDIYASEDDIPKEEKTDEKKDEKSDEDKDEKKDEKSDEDKDEKKDEKSDEKKVITLKEIEGAADLELEETKQLVEAYNALIESNDISSKEKLETTLKLHSGKEYSVYDIFYDYDNEDSLPKRIFNVNKKVADDKRIKKESIKRNEDFEKNLSAGAKAKNLWEAVEKVKEKAASPKVKKPRKKETEEEKEAAEFASEARMYEMARENLKHKREDGTYEKSDIEITDEELDAEVARIKGEQKNARREEAYKKLKDEKYVAYLRENKLMPGKESREKYNEYNKKLKETEKPAKEAEKPVKKAEEPAKKAEKPVKKAEEPAKKAEEPVKKAEEPVKKAEEPAKKAEEPVKKAEEPAKKAEEPAKKAEEPIKKAGEPAKKAEEPAKVTERETRKNKMVTYTMNALKSTDAKKRETVEKLCDIAEQNADKLVEANKYDYVDYCYENELLLCVESRLSYACDSLCYEMRNRGDDEAAEILIEIEAAACNLAVEKKYTLTPSQLDRAEQNVKMLKLRLEEEEKKKKAEEAEKEKINKEKSVDNPADNKKDEKLKKESENDDGEPIA